MNIPKLLDKMRNWIAYDPVMRQEMLEAKDEFFAFSEYDQDAGAKDNITGLLAEWFMYDRKTTRYLKTPAEVFLQYGAKGLTSTEKAFFKNLSKTIFGVFEVLSSDKEAGILRIKRLDGTGEWAIRDMKGSRSATAGSVIFARIIPLPDNPVFTGWVAGWPGGAADMRRIFSKAFANPEKITGFKPRHLLRLWAKPVNWIEKGEFFCKTRLAGIWQKWCGKSRPFAELESAVDAGDHSKYLIAEQTLVESCPDPEQVQEIMGLLQAYWNLASGSKAGLKTPVELVGEGPGPVEKSFLDMLGAANMTRHKKTGKEYSREENDAWLKTTANGEKGVSPFELISQERKARNHPYPDKIAYSIKIQGIANKTGEAASDKAQAATGFMMHKNFEKAARLYEDALTVLKHDKSISYRVLGNLGICYALMGERDRALETLREALRHNPDYDRARRHLGELESMTAAQYKKFLKNGPGHLTHSEWRE
ncbi:MAG TPA: hypothetical protein DCL44_01075 [Elusimicrobia bacterium]|nr:hypothetical protein [Elusimicrobiota bacterium]